MTATPESPVGEGEETKKNSESAESKQNGSTVNDENSQTVEKTTEKEMPPNEADMDTAKAPTSSETAPLASSEDLKVKFSGGARGSLGDGKEVKLEIMGKAEKLEENEYPALTKAELMEYAKDPFWIGLRWFLFIGFWLIWLAMLVASIVIIVMAPKCPPPAPKEWWQKAPIYEVYVKSFKDSDGDGIGDIKGVTSKLDYLTSLGVGSVWLSPIYKSGGKDNGYDVVDHTKIDEKLGTLEDFNVLVKSLHDNGIKLIMDFIPNHSSDKHEWFQKSVAQEGNYADYYIWKNSRTPNNWKSVFGGSAWEYNSQRRMSYLHQFYKEQPDLNLRNEEVKTKLKGIMNYWLDLGVDGFRIDSVAHFYEDQKFEDEPSASGVGYKSLEHTYTYNQPEVLELLAEFREVLDKKTEEDSYNPRIMMTEAYDVDLGMYYGNSSAMKDQIGTVSHMPLFFGMISKFTQGVSVTADLVKKTIMDYKNSLPVDDKTKEAMTKYDKLKAQNEAENKTTDPKSWPLGRAWPNYNIGNHDNSRAASRFGSKLLDAMNMVIMMLQGSSITYYGDEIGMTDFDGASSSEPDPKRNLYRTPMQWNNKNTYAGFSDAEAPKKPWLDINTNYLTVNVEMEQEAPNSHLKVYQELAKLRISDSILYGEEKIFTNGSFFAYSRVKKGNPGYLVAVNFDKNENKTQDVTNMELMPSRGTVQIRDSSNNGTERSRDLTKLSLGPEEGIVIAFVPDYNNKGKNEENNEKTE